MVTWIKNYKKWIKDSNISIKDKIIIHNMTNKEKKENFYTTLKFGTAGIRGIRGLGTNRMNFYLIKKITQGYCNYLKNKNKIKKNTVIIAYDTRHMSKEFAEEAAKVFGGNQIKSYFFNIARSTPELSFAVRYLNAAGGIVLTASHNPPEYNGYKIYNSAGAQFSTIETNKLISYVDKIKDLSQVKIDIKKNFIKFVPKEIEEKYIQKVKNLSLNFFNKNLKILYSSLHGVGLKPLKKLFDLVGANYNLVKKQCIYNGDFPTIKNPNPEEKQTFNLLVKYGIKTKAELLLATDPDADRVGVMVKYKNKYVYLTGNQIGGLLINYILKYKKYNFKNSYILTSIVTSRFGFEIAKRYGVKTSFVFTGFKNLGSKMEKYIKNGKTILFAYEESIGYLPELFIRDKDGISSALLIAEMTGVLKKEGKTLIDELKNLYKKVGYFKEKQFSYTLKGSQGFLKIKNIMKDLRNNGLDKNNILKEFKIEKEIDYLKSKLNCEHSDLLFFKFKDNSYIAVRPSGTEPKLKIYVNVVDKTKNLATSKCVKLINFLKNRIKNKSYPQN